MSTPSIRISPRSGWSRALRCFSSTVLPQPLVPTIVVILPVTKSRLTPRRTSCLPKLLCKLTTRIISQRLEHDRGKEIVPHEHEDEGKHDGLGRGPADARRHRRRVESL